MVMKPEPLVAAIDVMQTAIRRCRIILLYTKEECSTRKTRFGLRRKGTGVDLWTRYEGVDERVKGIRR
jgi:tRNA G37 N-methylase TrmD